MHPANAMRIQHVSSSPLAQFLWHGATIPESLRWKWWTVLQIMGLKIREEAKTCLENIKPLNLSVSISISAFLSLPSGTRARGKVVSHHNLRQPSGSNWRMPLQVTTEGCDGRVSLIPLIRWHGTQNKRSSNPYCAERQALSPSCHAGSRNVSQALSSTFKHPYILHSCAPGKTA